MMRNDFSACKLHTAERERERERYIKIYILWDAYTWQVGYSLANIFYWVIRLQVIWAQSV